MATTQQLETILDVESLPAPNWYQSPIDREVGELNHERLLAINYARAIEAERKQVRGFEEARRIAEISTQPSPLEELIALARRVAAGLYGRAERPEASADSIPAIEAAIEASRYILDMAENWDGEGSSGYSKATWSRATNFVRSTVMNYWRVSKQLVPAPDISHGPEGSIDVTWEAKGRELLINIPADEAIPAGYFGSGSPKDTVKGKLDTASQNSWILMWLMK